MLVHNSLRRLDNHGLPMSANLAFASAVAEFGMLLRHSEHKGDASYAAVAARARRFRGNDPEGYRAEFIKLWKDQPHRDLGFRFGYPDKEKNNHMLVTRRQGQKSRGEK